MRFLLLRSFLYSLAIHVVVITALIVNFDTVRQPPVKPRPKENIVEAVTVDDKAVEKELQRLRELEQEKQRAMEKKLKDLERKASEVEKKRKEEEKKKRPRNGTQSRGKNARPRRNASGRRKSERRQRRESALKRKNARQKRN